MSDDLVSRMSAAARAKIPLVFVLGNDERVVGRVVEVAIAFVVIARPTDAAKTQRIDLRDLVRVHRGDGRIFWPATSREATAS